MASLTVPNRWGKEGFNVIRQALLDYCRDVGTTVDLGYAFEWDAGTPLLKNSEDLSELQYANCNTALQMITLHLHHGCDPWQAVAKAELEWKEARDATAKILSEQDENESN